MHSIFVRANVVFFFALTTVFVLAFACSLTYRNHNPPITASLPTPSVVVLRELSTRVVNVDQLHLQFDLTCDLSLLWNWNVKQLFIWITVSYETATRPVRDSIIWDKVLHSRESSVLRLRNVQAKYGIIDFQKSLRGTNVTATLHWDIMPQVGWLKIGSANQVEVNSLALPLSYISTKR